MERREKYEVRASKQAENMFVRNRTMVILTIPNAELEAIAREKDPQGRDLAADSLGVKLGSTIVQEALKAS